MKHKLSSIAEQPWHPQLCTQYSASRLTTTSVLGFSPRMRFGREVGKGHYAEETDQRYGTRRKCAVEERSHLKEDIRKPFLPLFVCYQSVIAFIIYSLGLSTFCRSHSLPHTIPLYLLVSLITFLYPNC